VSIRSNRDKLAFQKKIYSIIRRVIRSTCFAISYPLYMRHAFTLDAKKHITLYDPTRNTNTVKCISRVNFHKFEPKYDHLALSGVYKLLLEEEQRRGRTMELPTSIKPQVIAKKGPAKAPSPLPPKKEPTPPPKEPTPPPKEPTPPPKEPTPPPKEPTPPPKEATPPPPEPEPTPVSTHPCEGSGFQKHCFCDSDHWAPFTANSISIARYVSITMSVCFFLTNMMSKT
jgi:hypothetical protein